MVANAGTLNDTAPLWELTEEQFQDQIDVNLTGVWKTIKATVPILLAQNEGGAIILISSISGLTVELNIGHYAASKHGVNGLMRTLAGELAPHNIRVNSVNPTNVNTPMINNPRYNRLFAGGKEGATQDDALEALTAMHALPVPFLDPSDVSNAVVYLASDDGRYVTGTAHIIDAGALNPFKAPHLTIARTISRPDRPDAENAISAMASNVSRRRAPMIRSTATNMACATTWQRLDIQLSRCDMLTYSSAGFAQATLMSKSAPRTTGPGGPSEVRTEPYDVTRPKNLAGQVGVFSDSLREQENSQCPSSVQTRRTPRRGCRSPRPIGRRVRL